MTIDALHDVDERERVLDEEEALRDARDALTRSSTRSGESERRSRGGKQV